MKTDPKLFWSYVISKLKTKTTLSQLKESCGTLTNDNTEKTELLNKYFASVFETEGPGPLPEFHDKNFADALSTNQKTSENTTKAISKLKSSKSQRPDILHPKTHLGMY